MSKQRIVVIAGPNGSGKTTIAGALLRSRAITKSLNADDLAKGLSGMNPALAAFEAGEMLLRKIQENVILGASFAFETTLSGKCWVRSMPLWKANGIEVSVIYLWLAHVELSVARVASRAHVGGHSIDEDTIRRRYLRSVKNFMNEARILPILGKSTIIQCQPAQIPIPS